MTDPEPGGADSAWTAERWLVSGRVQGVGFRYHVYRAASLLGVAGDVRNLPDGRVEVRVSGPRDRCSALRAAVESGPPGASVGAVEAAGLDGDLRFDSFSIR